MNNLSIKTTIAAVTRGSNKFFLEHATPGIESAGSGTRQVSEYYAVYCYVGGARYGRRFKTEAEARAYLASKAA